MYTMVIPKTALALVVLGTVAAAVSIDLAREERVAVDVSRAGGSGLAASARESEIDLVARLRRERFAPEVKGNPFASRDASRPAAVAAPQPPAPPPLAYRYGGQFRIDNGGWRVYLLKGSDLVPINVGDVLDGPYKVTAIGADEFEIMHLPTSTKRVLQYSSLGTGSTLASDQGSLAPQAGMSSSGAAPSVAAFSGSTSGSQPVRSPTAPAVGAAVVPGFAVAAPGVSPGVAAAPAAASSGTALGSITGGATPRGTLGASGPSGAAPRLGVAPPASGSMPMSPAPAGTMQTLPAPTGRLGV